MAGDHERTGKGRGVMGGTFFAAHHERHHYRRTIRLPQMPDTIDGEVITNQRSLQEI